LVKFLNFSNSNLYRLDIFSSEVCSHFFKENSILHIPIHAGVLESDFDKYFRGVEVALAICSASGVSKIENEFMMYMRRKSVPVVQFVDQWVNLETRFSNRDPALMPDYILVIDHTSRAVLIKMGVNPDIVFVIGQPYFESLMHRNHSKHSGLPRKYLLATQPVSIYYPELALGYDEFTFLDATLNASIEAGILLSDVHIMVHPAEPLEKYGTYTAQYQGIEVFKNRIVDYSKYRAVVGMYSSILVQCALQKVPTASVQIGAIGSGVNTWLGINTCSGAISFL
jgi:hypothetical protein